MGRAARPAAGQREGKGHINRLLFESYRNSMRETAELDDA